MGKGKVTNSKEAWHGAHLHLLGFLSPHGLIASVLTTQLVLRSTCANPSILFENSKSQILSNV